MEKNKIISCGLGVLYSGYLGLFDIITDASYRQQGYGKLLIKNLINWGINNFAQTAYLQVMVNNIPAINLYSNLGFREQYQYWYRVK
jgi:ribosomal protein S18 acetylase RimI-like enzyme